VLVCFLLLNIIFMGFWPEARKLLACDEKSRHNLGGYISIIWQFCEVDVIEPELNNRLTEKGFQLNAGLIAHSES